MAIKSKHVQAGSGSWLWPLTTCTTLQEPTSIRRASAVSFDREPASDLILYSGVAEDGSLEGKLTLKPGEGVMLSSIKCCRLNVCAEGCWAFACMSSGMGR
jgi:hypothetical protein